MSHRGHKTTIHSQKEWDCLEITNYKIQITNKLQIPNYKLQIKKASCMTHIELIVVQSFFVYSLCSLCSLWLK